MTKNAKIMIISNISVEAFFNTSLDNETQECSFEYKEKNKLNSAKQCIKDL